MNAPVEPTYVIVAAVLLITIVPMFRYKTVDEFQKYWSAVGSMVIATMSAVVTFYFSRQSAASAANQGAEKAIAALARDDAFGLKELANEFKGSRDAVASLAAGNIWRGQFVTPVTTNGSNLHAHLTYEGDGLKKQGESRLLILNQDPSKVLE